MSLCEEQRPDMHEFNMVLLLTFSVLVFRSPAKFEFEL